MKKQSILFLFMAVVMTATFLASTASKASAHAISIGFENAGPGSVTAWLGTYSHGVGTLEGSMTLEGALGTVFGPVTNPFTTLTGDGAAFKPAGLIDGVTNFYISTPLNVDGPLVASEAFFNSECPACGPVQHWQGVTFSGLVAGDYQFTYVAIANPSLEWTPWNNNLNGTFNLAGVVEPPSVPEPSSLLLLGSGLVALAAALRRKRSV